MTFPDALWSAILENPHDNQPRLALAHWLDERDDPRGEFIRLQISLESLPLSSPLRMELEAREHELLADHEHDWLGDLDPLVDWAVFHRGFPSEIATSADVFLRHGAAIVTKAPITMVHLDRVRDRARQLADCATLQRISFLDLSNNHLRDHGVRFIAESPYVGSLEGLNLTSTACGDAGAKALAASRQLEGLRELYLCDNRITPAGVRALAGSPLVQQLEVLSLRFNERLGKCASLTADPALSLQM